MLVRRHGRVPNHPADWASMACCKHQKGAQVEALRKDHKLNILEVNWQLSAKYIRLGLVAGIGIVEVEVYLGRRVKAGG